jgi:LEA14-like dessication related protein
MVRVTLPIFGVCLLLLLSACSTLSSHYEQPHLSITSFTLSPETSNITPQFEVGLRIINPNRQALALKGMSYSIEIEGHRILNGAEPNLPLIAGYDTADIILTASPDLLGSVRLIKHILSQQNRGDLAYLFKAKLDIGTLMPYVTIEEKGHFSLNL